MAQEEELASEEYIPGAYGIKEKRKGLDLLSIPGARALAKSRYMPLSLQTFNVLLLFISLYLSFSGLYHRNFGTFAFWLLFWPTTMLFTLFFIGRVWCGVCPVGAVSAAVERVGKGTKISRRFRNVGLSVTIFISMWIVFYAYTVAKSASFSGWFFTVFLAAAAGTSVFLGSRAWCRHICPLCGTTRLYSQFSSMELRSTPEKCEVCSSKACMTGTQYVQGCPTGVFPGKLDSNADCTYCLNCVKSCPNDSIQIRFRMWGKDLAKVRKPSMAMAVLALGLVSIFPLGMTLHHAWHPEAFMNWQKDISSAWGFDSTGTMGVIAVTSALVISLGAWSLLSLVGSKLAKIDYRKVFGLFAYALVPVVFLSQMGHVITLNILEQGGTYLNSTLPAIGIQGFWGPAIVSQKKVDDLGPYLFDWIDRIGAIFGIYLIYRIARNQDWTRKQKFVAALPAVIFIAGLLAFREWASTQPPMMM